MSGYVLPPVRDWDDWRPIFTDAALWRPAIDRIWAARGRPSPDRVEAGFPGTCAVFIVSGPGDAPPVVVKLFPPMVAHDFDRERAVYALLDGALPELPRVLGAGVWRDRQAWPYLLTSFRPGRAWREARAEVPRRDQPAVAKRLGEMLRVVHDTAVGDATDGWRRFVADRLAAAPGDLRRRTALPRSVIDEYAALLERTDWFAGRPRPLHADLTADHVLVARRGERWAITGLIDWADSEVGDVGYEWPALWFDFCGRDARLFEAVTAGYGGGCGADAARLLAFTGLHRFGAEMIGLALDEAEQRAVVGLEELARRLSGDVSGD